MIDNGSKTWSVFTFKPDPDTDNRWVVVGTKWTENGPQNERLIGRYGSEAAAAKACVDAQQHYDRLRDVLLSSAREVNRNE